MIKNFEREEIESKIEKVREYLREQDRHDLVIEFNDVIIYLYEMSNESIDLCRRLIAELKDLINDKGEN